jgi:hypothetical protein
VVDAPPSRAELAELTIAALRALGGSASAKAIRQKVAELGQLTEEQVNHPGPLSSRTRTRLAHGVDWSLQSLRNRGIVMHNGRRPATWSLTDR